MTDKVAVVGLGAMGRGMAASLRRAGFEVHACDMRAEAVAAFVADGGVGCATTAEAAKACEVVISVVVNAEQTEGVLFGPQGCAAVMRPGSVFVMCSTVDPRWSADLERRLDRKSVV